MRGEARLARAEWGVGGGKVNVHVFNQEDRMVQDVFTGNADGLNKQTGSKRNSNEKKEKLPEGGNYICFPLEVSALHHFCFCDREPSQTSVNLWGGGTHTIMDAPWLFPVSAGLSATVSLQQHQTQAEQFQAAFLLHPSPAGSRPSPPPPPPPPDSAIL